MPDPLSIVIGAAGTVAGALGVWLPQRNRRVDRRSSAQLADAAAQASVTVAALQEWQKIVAAKDEREKQLMDELAEVQVQRRQCRQIVQSYRAQLHAAGLLVEGGPE